MYLVRFLAFCVMNMFVFVSISYADMNTAKHALQLQDYNLTATIIINEAEKDKSKAKARLTELLKNQDEKIDMLQSQVFDLSEMVSLQSRGNNDLQNDMNNLSSSLANRDDERERLQNRIKELEEKLAEAISKLNQK